MVVLSVLSSCLDVILKGYSAFVGGKISFHQIVVYKKCFCHIKILLDNNNNNYYY
jgi:hypothetical protein